MSGITVAMRVCRCTMHDRPHYHMGEEGMDLVPSSVMDQAVHEYLATQPDRLEGSQLRDSAQAQPLTGTSHWPREE